MPKHITLLSAISAKPSNNKIYIFFQIDFSFYFYSHSIPFPHKEETFQSGKLKHTTLEWLSFHPAFSRLYFYIHRHAHAYKSKLLFIVLSWVFLPLSSRTESAIFLTTQVITCSNCLRDKNKNGYISKVMFLLLKHSILLTASQVRGLWAYTYFKKESVILLKINSSP